MSLLNFLSAASTAGTQAAGAYQQGKQDKRKQETQDLIDQIKLARQAQQDQMMKQSQEITNTYHEAQTNALTTPKPPEPFTLAPGATRYNPDGTPIVASPAADRNPLMGSPEWKDAERFKAGLVQPTNVFQTGVDAQGKPTIFAGKNRGDPNLTDTGVNRPTTGASGSGRSLPPEEMDKMRNQARLDAETMKVFEDKVKAGTATLGPVDAGLGAGASQRISGLGSGLSAGLQNKMLGSSMLGNPEYQKYVIAQRSFGRIMGNLQSKRYSDAQAEMERSISGLNADDRDGTIDYKQNLRREALGDYEHGTRIPTGQGGIPASVLSQGKPSLTARIAQLKAQRVSKEQAKATLISEGYSVP